MVLRWLLLLLWCAVPVGSARAQASVPVEQKFTVGGVERTAQIYAPAGAKAASPKLPVLFAFHGHGGSMQQAAQSFGYQRIWPDAIVVYMQGLPTPGALTDPNGNRNGWQRSAGDQNDRDLKFFDTVLVFLKKQYPIDTKRLFAAGHSNGGSFTYLLGAERPGVFAAIAPSAAMDARSLRRMKPIPVLHVAGENDPLVRFAMQSRMMQAVRRVNGCTSEGKAWAKKGSVVGTYYASTLNAPFVSVIHPGTHVFPGAAAELAVKFFQEVTAPKKQ